MKLDDRQKKWLMYAVGALVLAGIVAAAFS